MTTSRSGMHTEAHDPHRVEWVVGMVSTLLVLALVGWIGWEAVTDKPEPPEFATNIIAVRSMADGDRVEFEVANRSGTTAAAVVIRGEAAAETIDVTFDYVPAQSTARGALIFSPGATRSGLSIKAIGYTEP